MATTQLKLAGHDEDGHLIWKRASTDTCAYVTYNHTENGHVYETSTLKNVGTLQHQDNEYWLRETKCQAGDCAGCGSCKTEAEMETAAWETPDWVKKAAAAAKAGAVYAAAGAHSMANGAAAAAARAKEALTKGMKAGHEMLSKKEQNGETVAAINQANNQEVDKEVEELEKLKNKTDIQQSCNPAARGHLEQAIDDPPGGSIPSVTPPP
jgi:hypothetical protein